VEEKAGELPEERLRNILIPKKKEEKRDEKEGAREKTLEVVKVEKPEIPSTRE